MDMGFFAVIMSVLGELYLTDAMKEKKRQLDVVNNIYYEVDEKYQVAFGTVNNGITSLKHAYDLQFNLDDIKPFEKKFKERDEHLRSIKAKQKELKAEGVSDDKKSQLNADIADLTKKVNKISKDYETAIQGIETIALSDDDKGRDGIGYCIEVIAASSMMGAPDDSGTLDAMSVLGLTGDLKYDDDKGKIGVCTITGKQYVSLFDSCFSAIDIVYAGLIKGKGFSADSEVIDLNLSDDQIQSLKDSIKDE
ncbi:MAG: hypothetical protein ACON5A_02325 [Candidatus Comchoanobacterales bacterium]